VTFILNYSQRIPLTQVEQDGQVSSSKQEIQEGEEDIQGKEDTQAFTCAQGVE
jgi:hypothetical protein